MLNSTEFPEMNSFIQRVKAVGGHDQTLELLSYDLIAKEDPDRTIVHNKLTGSEPFSNLKESKAFASFAGLAIGDSLGCLLEGSEIDYSRNLVTGFENVHDVLGKCGITDVRCKSGQFTDDTALALCIADSLIEKKLEYDAKDLCYRFFHWYFSGYNNGRNTETDTYEQYSGGIGAATYNACSKFIYNPTDRVPGSGKEGKENGNGTVMRLAPIAIAFNTDIQKCMEYAAEQSYTTHNGEEASECCRLLCYIVANFLNMNTVEECKKFLEEFGASFKSECSAVQDLALSRQENEDKLKDYHPAYNPSIEDRNWNWKDAGFKYSPHRAKTNSILVGIYCMDATAMALHIVYHTKSFKEAILKAVNLGGDADTVAAVVGMLAGAIYGYDEDVKRWYMNYVAKWDEEKCAIRAYKLLKMAEASK